MCVCMCVWERVRDHVRPVLKEVFEYFTQVKAILHCRNTQLKSPALPL